LAGTALTPAGWIAAAAVPDLPLGLVLILGGQGVRRYHGLGAERTVALDEETLSSRRYGLTGRMDRLIREGSVVTPEEWKSSSQCTSSRNSAISAADWPTATEIVRVVETDPKAGEVVGAMGCCFPRAVDDNLELAV
jgi:hypothetical protein